MGPGRAGLGCRTGAVVTAMTVTRIMSRIEHGCPPDMALRWIVREGAWAVAAWGDSGGRWASRALRRAAFRAWSVGPDSEPL